MHKRWIHCRFDMFKAVDASSRDHMDVDGLFLYEISLNAY
jgi:hypothetical protein